MTTNQSQKTTATTAVPDPRQPSQAEAGVKVRTAKRAGCVSNCGIKFNHAEAGVKVCTNAKGGPGGTIYFNHAEAGVKVRTNAKGGPGGGLSFNHAEASI